MPVVAQQALDEKTMHEWGYVYTWPPVIDDLTLREYRKIQLAEQGEAYIKHETREQNRRGGKSMSHKHYDVNESRRKWRENRGAA